MKNKRRINALNQDHALDEYDLSFIDNNSEPELTKTQDTTEENSKKQKDCGEWSVLNKYLGMYLSMTSSIVSEC
jgi:hypothetical protein